MEHQKTLHKAITALIGSLFTIAGLVSHEHIDLDPELIGAIGTLLTTAFVYLIPNKEKEK